MADPTPPTGDIEAALQAGVAIAEPRSFGMPKASDGANPTIPFVVVPNGYAIKDLGKLFLHPLRPEGSVVLLDASSFARYVAETASEAGINGPRLRVYGQRHPLPQFVAVFNDDGHGDHTAHYKYPLSAEWLKWAGNDKQPKNQTQFAEFIEENRLDITDPPTADMVELARTFQAKADVSFKSGVRLGNGDQQFVFEETTAATAGERGQMTVPEKFTIGIPVFDGGEKWAVDCWLRYRLDKNNGKLSLHYQMDNARKVMDEAVNEVWDAIERGTGSRIFHGTAPVKKSV